MKSILTLEQNPQNEPAHMTTCVMILTKHLKKNNVEYISVMYKPDEQEYWDRGRYTFLSEDERFESILQELVAQEGDPGYIQQVGHDRTTDLGGGLSFRHRPLETTITKPFARLEKNPFTGQVRDHDNIDLLFIATIINAPERRRRR